MSPFGFSIESPFLQDPEVPLRGADSKELKPGAPTPAGRTRSRDCSRQAERGDYAQVVSTDADTWTGPARGRTAARPHGGLKP